MPLTEINHLLLDEDFRTDCLARVKDPLVHQTFDFYDRHGRGQAGSTLRRAFLLSFSPVTRGVLGQRENWLDIRALMDAGRSLIINLGTVSDPVTRRLLGSLVMVQIEQAALSRTNLAPQHRTPWWCLVDEWPSFSATRSETIEHVLSQTRKYNLRLYLAAQALAQIDTNRLGGALENCRLSVTFRLGAESARIQAKHIATIDPYRVKVHAQTPNQRDQYMSTSEQFEEWVQAILHLPPRQAFVKVHEKQALAMKTLTVREPKLDATELEEVLSEYRRRYQRPAREVEAGGLAAEVASDETRGSDILAVDTTYEQKTTNITDFESFFGEYIGPDNAESP